MSKAEQVLAERFLLEFSQDAARLLEQRPADETAALLAEIPSEVAAALLNCFAANMIGRAVLGLPVATLVPIVQQMSPEPAGLLLRRLGPEERRRVLAELEPKTAELLLTRLQYPEESVGAVMSYDFLALDQNQTVREALKFIRRHRPSAGHLAYVADSALRFSGYLHWKDLVSAAASASLSSLVRRDMAVLHGADLLSAVLKHRDWHRFPELPVVDGAGTLIGVMDYETFRDLESGGGRLRPPGEVAVGALGELYSIGIAGLLKGAMFPTRNQGEARNP